jgi:hypothetical protein
VRRLILPSLHMAPTFTLRYVLLWPVSLTLYSCRTCTDFVSPVSGFCFIGLAFRKDRRDRLFHYITAAVVFVAAIAYFTMGSNLGFTPIHVQYERLAQLVSSRHPQRRLTRCLRDLGRIPKSPGPFARSTTSGTLTGSSRRHCFSPIFCLPREWYVHTAARRQIHTDFVPTPPAMAHSSLGHHCR